MNPLNTQQQPAPPAAQYYKTGMPPLTPATATSILKTNISTAAAPTVSQHQPAAIVASALTSGGGSNLLDSTKYVATTANYMPVLLTNQTLISSVDTTTAQQQSQHPSSKLATSTLLTHGPVVDGTNTANNTNMPLIAGGGNKPMVLATSNTAGNITYQVLSTSQNNNLTPVITSPNGTVSVLLASSQPMVTAGHVAAPIIIRNTPTTANTSKTVQIKQQQQQHLAKRQQQHQQKSTLHAFNPQSYNADILKQIVVGNPSPGATVNLAPGTTLLKPTILQNKPIIQQQQQQNTNKSLIKNTKMLVTSTQPQQQHQLQQKLNNHTVITTTSDNSSQMFAALGMELVKAPTNVAQSVQKLPQVSLLQNSNKKPTNSNSEIINEPVVTVLNNPHEIQVGNLNSEVSLIKKPNASAIEMKSKDGSLLKTSNRSSEIVDKRKQQQDLEKPSLQSIAKTNSSNGSGNNKQEVAMKKETNSLLKPSNNVKKITEVDNNTAKTVNIPIEKQKSLLKPKANQNNNKTAQSSTQPTKAPTQTSPRSQRSNSCNTTALLKEQEASSASNERRHSEPIKMELLLANDSKDNQTDEIEIYFEDEEYLESSGDKSPINSEKSLANDNNSPKPNKELKEIMEKSTAKEADTNPETEKPKQNDMLDTTKEKKNMESKEEDKEKKSSESNRKHERHNVSPRDNDDDDEEDDDDVTILPMEDVEIEQIEIDDDEDDIDSGPCSEDKNQQLNESLLCDEQILISSSSSLSNNSIDQNTATASLIKSPKSDNPTTSATSIATTSPLLKKTLMEPKPHAQREEPHSNGYSSVLDMLSNFNMLSWREKIGTARGTNLRFQLNEFNLVQLYEKSMPNKRIHTAYEKPIYERESSHRRNENGDPPTYYMCRRCNVQGPSVDFLAPEFCSLSCLKRDCRKRRDDSSSLMRKRNRLGNLNANNNNKNYTNIVNINNDVISTTNPPPLAYIKKPKFRWSNYMNSNFPTLAAPISLFLNPFPTGPNNFIIGMKLEAIDPENCALFCVCTIIDVMGYRLKLSFDGYDSAYDFWLNADSMDIFPPGWCAKTNRILQPPKGISTNKFNWSTYLSKEKAVPAPRHLFTHLNSSSLVPRNPFKIGMHLEAEDLNDTGKLCVASVADVLDDRIRIHFDGWDDCYDIIVDINSPYIHPCGWHEGRQQLVVPPDCENTAFNWDDYIHKQGTGEAASEELFAPREPIGFKPNMRLEVVDPRNPSLIRPATVVSHKGHRVKLHLDCWPIDYCFWLEDDSPDLHPIGWCDATGHDLEPPPGFQMAKQKMPCPVEGCRGIGNAKKAFMGVHATREGCPYASENWRIVVEKPQRVNYDNIVRTLPKQNKHNLTHQVASLQSRLSEQQILERLQMLDNIKTRNVLVQQEKLPTNHSDLLGGFSMPHIKKEEFKENKYSKISNSNSATGASQQTTEPLDIKLDISKEFLCDYGPRLQQNYTLWQKNFTFDADKIKRNPLKWTTTEVSVFVDLYLKCRNTSSRFSQEDIDGEAFLLLQQHDLTEKLGMKLGPAVKLYTCILQLRTLAVTKFDVPYKRTGVAKI